MDYLSVSVADKTLPLTKKTWECFIIHFVVVKILVTNCHRKPIAIIWDLEQNLVCHLQLLILILQEELLSLILLEQLLILILYFPIHFALFIHQHPVS